MGINIKLFDEAGTQVREWEDWACVSVFDGRHKEPWHHGEGRLCTGKSNAYGWRKKKEAEWSKEDLEDYFECLKKSSFNKYVHSELRFGNILFPCRKEWTYAQHQVACTLIRDLGEYPVRVEGVLKFWRECTKTGRRRYNSNTSIIMGWWANGASTSHGFFPRSSTKGMISQLPELVKMKKNVTFASSNFTTNLSGLYPIPVEYGSPTKAELKYALAYFRSKEK